MQEDWEPVMFNTSKYKETGLTILSAVDDIQTILDDHIVKTQTMKGSPFIKPFEENIKVSTADARLSSCELQTSRRLGKRVYSSFNRSSTCGSKCNPIGCKQFTRHPSKPHSRSSFSYLDPIFCSEDIK